MVCMCVYQSVCVCLSVSLSLSLSLSVCVCVCVCVRGQPGAELSFGVQHDICARVVRIMVVVAVGVRVPVRGGAQPGDAPLRELGGMPITSNIISIC